MSFAAAHESKSTRKSCRSCRDRKARFQYRGVVRADRDHTLCFECYRSELNRQRAQRLAAVLPPRPIRIEVEPRSPFKPTELSAKQITHRRAMLLSLQGGTGHRKATL